MLLSANGGRSSLPEGHSDGSGMRRWRLAAACCCSAIVQNEEPGHQFLHNSAFSLANTIQYIDNKKDLDIAAALLLT